MFWRGLFLDPRFDPSLTTETLPKSNFLRVADVGEKLDALEDFRPEGLADRILGYGDIVGLMQDFERVADKKEAEQDAKKMLEGNFSFEDLLK